jgi:hypothetical protein
MFLPLGGPIYCKALQPPNTMTSRLVHPPGVGGVGASAAASRAWAAILSAIRE